jgi:SPP1 gp7 family putative phage head morphogenesis protein
VIIDARPIQAEIGGTEQQLTAAIYGMFRGTLSYDMALQISRKLKRLLDRKSELSEADILSVINGIDFDKWEPLVDLVAVSLVSAATYSVVRSLWRVGVSEDEAMGQTARRAAERWAKRRAAELLGMRRLPSGKLVPNPNAKFAITETTRDMVRQMVVDAVMEGWTTEQLTNQLRGSHAFSAARAENIARTELRSAVSGGQLAAFRSSGLASGKRWRTKKDAKVEQHCRENEAVGIIDIAAPFPSGHQHPTAHPNCRCWLDFVA